jgi:putative phosphoesterase
MKIGVISDTHNPSVGELPPDEVATAFKGVDAIIHAGDIYIPSCLDWLESIAPVYAVEMWANQHFQDDPRVIDKRRVVELEGYSIGIIHDLQVPGMVQEITEYSPLAKHFPPEGDLSQALQTIFNKPVDIVIFGHTHYPIIEEYQGILMINPGSPSLPKQRRRLGQIAILEISPNTKTAELIELATYS